MQKAEVQSPVVRFGLFEVDLHTGESRKGGQKVKLQEQPFQVLAKLLERPGEMVTRKELQEKLWPYETVDFDSGLNKAIQKIRRISLLPRLMVASGSSRCGQPTVRVRAPRLPAGAAAAPPPAAYRHQWRRR